MSYLGVIFFMAFVITTFHILMTKLDDYPNLQQLLEEIAIIIALFFALRIMFFITFIVDPILPGERSTLFLHLRLLF